MHETMITISRSAAALISLTLLLAVSCKKDNTSITPSTGGNTSFTYKLNGGAAVTIDSANATLYTTGGQRMIDVYAFKSGMQVLEFHFTPATGSKPAGTTLGVGSFLTYMDPSLVSWDSQSGNMNLTTCDTIGKKLEGDFNFIGKEYPYSGSATRTISDGHMLVTKLTIQ